MKKILLNLVLASTLLLGNGCGERTPRHTYTAKDGAAEITLEDYYHEYNLEIKTPDGKRLIHAKKYCVDDEEAHVTTVIDYMANKTNRYSVVSEEGRRILKEAQPMFNKYLNAFIPKNVETPVRKFNIPTENSSLFKQLE
jgi:hypothetical protein